MPVIYVADEAKKPVRVVQLVFPRLTARDAPEMSRWEWDEVQAGISPIQGFGLYPKSGGCISWEKLDRPLALPYLGKETEVECASQARVLRSVLSGCFDMCRRDDLRTPDGSSWVQDGIYVTLRLTKEAVRERDTLIAADEMLLQV